MTFKDHKDNFRSDPTIRLINSSKNELGKVSKQLKEKLEKISSEYLKILVLALRLKLISKK